MHLRRARLRRAGAAASVVAAEEKEGDATVAGGEVEGERVAAGDCGGVSRCTDEVADSMRRQVALSDAQQRPIAAAAASTSFVPSCMLRHNLLHTSTYHIGKRCSTCVCASLAQRQCRLTNVLCRADYSLVNIRGFAAAEAAKQRVGIMGRSYFSSKVSSTRPQ